MISLQSTKKKSSFTRFLFPVYNFELSLSEAEITGQDSLLLMRNLLRIAIFNISYIRGLFPEKYFNDKSVPALVMKIKKLMPMDAEFCRLIDWMEKGVYDALQKCCAEEEAHNPWTKNPLKMEVGNVNSKHLVLALKVKSVLDPCEDENDDNQDDEVSLGADFMQMDDSSETDSEVNQSQEDQYIVAQLQPQEDNSIPQEVNSMDDAATDDTQDPEEDEQQFSRIKDWISSHHLDTVEDTDVLSNFPDISVVLTEEIMDRLVAEGVLSKTGEDSYTKKKSDHEFIKVRKEMDCQVVPDSGKSPNANDHLYMKALYHVLPMQYVSIAKLQNKLGGEANQNTVPKMIDKMAREGLVETMGNRRLGKFVLHSDITKKKLLEVQKAFNYDGMDVDNTEPQSKSNHQGFYPVASNYRNTSTCGVLHSIGSDLTRMKIRADSNECSPTRTEQTTSMRKEHGNTPTSRAHPQISRESFAPGNDENRTNGNTNHCDEDERVMCSSRSTQDKRSRKTSMVKEPILQYTKRQKPSAIQLDFNNRS
ncbi:hypothetical protein ACLB2K_010682 [Fragaria x ananassa]